MWMEESRRLPNAPRRCASFHSHSKLLLLHVAKCWIGGTLQSRRLNNAIRQSAVATGWRRPLALLDDQLNTDVFEFFCKHFGNETGLHQGRDVVVHVAIQSGKVRTPWKSSTPQNRAIN